MATPETPTTEEIWHWLSQVPDLEIPVISLTERGIIRAVEWQGDGVLQVAIKRVPGGAFSTWANAALTADDVIAALDRRLGQTTLGDPRAEGVRMEPVVGKRQRDEVLNNIRLLQAEVEMVSGDPEAVRLLAGNPSAGAYLNPVLLYCDTPLKARAVHEVEAFGPVATVMPYDDTQEAVALARLGKGSLVASVFTNDRGGRGGRAGPRTVPRTGHDRQPGLGQNVYRARIAAGATGPRRARPGWRRRGNGRNAGGEALYAAHRHSGRWMAGADTGDTSVHPFRKSLADLRPGDGMTSEQRQVTLEDITHFAQFTGDTFYAHMDDDAARAIPFFDGRVAHGYLIVSFTAGLFVDPASGPVLANYGVDNLRFLAPVYPGDSLRVRLICKEISPRASTDHGEVRRDCRASNQSGAVVAQYDVLTMVAKVWPPIP
jgi:oxepin-CoA hydrolase / 3-oxo-5,6-dehydrosuberyl-CoA semialdehyde dehydrogenase